MPTKLITPGVYITEKDAFPKSAVVVETAVPVFVGYAEKAEWNGKSLLKTPTRITSLAEYEERFGRGFRAKFTITDTDPTQLQESFVINGKQVVARINDNHTFYLYNSMRLFFANGGGSCYVLVIDTYQDKPDGLEMKVDAYLTTDSTANIFTILANEAEPTLVVLPDAIHLGEVCYEIYTRVLAHCAKMQNRFAIFDLVKQLPSDTSEDIVATFREKTGMNNLSYGAAYYPWLITSIVQPDEVTFESLDDSVDLCTLLPATDVAAIVMIKKYKQNTAPSDSDKLSFHQTLKTSSPTYNIIIEALRLQLNQLPASGAIAGVYTTVDNNRGVWKAPANVSVSMVNAPSINISNEQQEGLNIDALSGKSINVIRAFPGIGTLIWGGRTLDGNSQDWRYINARRTLIMIEQSLKLATRAYVFQPNDANTWITVKSMMTNFLANLWKQGALVGAAPEQAFDVQIGLGATMTPTDILDGIMCIVVKVAILRPTEFVVITFQQQMQQS